MKVASNPRKKTSQHPNFVSDVADQVIGPHGWVGTNHLNVLCTSILTRQCSLYVGESHI
jgi:hypothetical protein